MYSVRDDPMGRVSPFGNSRINAYSRLPTTYRSVSRPSSPLSAKASTRCPFALDCEAVAYRDKSRYRSCSDFFSAFWLRTAHTNECVPRTGSGLCNLFTMSNNDARQEAERIPDFCHSDPETHRKPASLNNWWSWTGSNRRPPACKAGALPIELQPHIFINC